MSFMYYIVYATTTDGRKIYSARRLKKKKAKNQNPRRRKNSLCTIYIIYTATAACKSGEIFKFIFVRVSITDIKLQ